MKQDKDTTLLPTLRVTKDLKKKIKEEARRQGLGERGMSIIIRRALNAYLN